VELLWVRELVWVRLLKSRGPRYLEVACVPLYMLYCGHFPDS